MLISTAKAAEPITTIIPSMVSASVTDSVMLSVSASHVHSKASCSRWKMQMPAPRTVRLASSAISRQPNGQTRDSR